MMDVLSAPVASVLLGTAGGFVSNVLLQRGAVARDQRARIFNDSIPRCHQAIERYVMKVTRDGALACMDIHEIAQQLREVYRASVAATRSDAIRAHMLVLAANDLDAARTRYEAGELPRRIRDGGWAKLALDTVAQAEAALIEYEAWLQVRLLGRRLRLRTNYRSIEIDRDHTDEDMTRFACPAEITGVYVSSLVDREVCSWVVLDGHRVYGRILLFWLEFDDSGDDRVLGIHRDVATSLYETVDGWLHPLGMSEDSELRACGAYVRLSNDVSVCLLRGGSRMPRS